MKYLLYLVLFLMLAGCVSHDGYIISGNVPTAWEGRDVQLVVADVNRPYVLDSTVVAGGKFQFKGKFDVSRYCKVVVYLDPARQKPTLVYNCPVFLDSTAVQIDCDNSGKEPKFKVTTTSAAYALYQEYKDAYQKLSQQLGYGAMFDEYRQVQYSGVRDKEKSMELAAKLSDIKSRMRSFRKQFVKEHADSPVGLYVARGVCEKQSYFSREDMEDMWAAFSVKLQQSEPGQNFQELVQQKKIFLGQPFPDMELMAPDGSMKKISDYVVPGHYTLLEFWASWCAPCRGEIPNMKEAYAKYHSKGFDIISVSIDVDAKAWKKAMASENMPWHQLCDHEYKHPAKSIFAAYEGTGVPYSILLDEQGNIIHFDARGGWLTLALHEKFN